ncbi:NADP-dependent oxidoreductase [Oceanibaculum indicum]|uniref:Zinc-containing alcohol dehydrogenase superfamily protein n=1 Tax=Oceanibaculum indicum P24 TaxID=1207063 RepID=K2JX09_9PROT|nr:NADP-dependent oxidoreductase [Oceanibaculum indicum]EKE74834.1 zinc-containing alcohol dehydrogenase superfamily protein [Oceanibaculum indicum P24]
MTMNRQITLASRPVGAPTPDNFKLVETAVPTPERGQVLVKALYLSLDPYMRGRMSDAKSYAPSVKIGEVMTGGAVGRVIDSRHPGFKEGDIVEGRIGWQDYGLVEGGMLRKVDPDVAPISTALGVLGMPGLTAYFGLFEIGKPRPGETLVVSAASGAVGAVVCQLGKMAGARVVGIAGGPDKCAYVKDELGVDAVIDYKAEKDLAKALAAACPDGIDVYFDNVGGPVTDAIANLFNLRARMIVCGLISHYNMPDGYVGPSILRSVLTNRVLIQGMIVFDWHDRWPAGIAQLGKFVKAGKLKYKEDVTEGLENAPATFIGMLEGRNFGKTIIKIAE